MTSTTAWLGAYLGALSADTGSAGPPPTGWSAAAAIAEHEGVAPALAFGLRRRGDAAVPAAVAARLAARFNVALARHVIASRHLARLLRGLADAGIATVVLKGAYLGETLYPHPALRAMSDIDLLIRRGDRFRVDAALQGLGYRRGTDAHSWAFDVTYDGATFYDNPDGARVDVHWRLLNEPRYGWDHAAAEAVWDRTVSVTLAGEPARALSPEDLVLALAAHLAVHHGLSGLRWYWDLKLVLDRWSQTLDWDAIVARAGRWRVRSALFFVLRGLGERFQTPDVVRAVTVRLAPRGPRSAALRWLVARHAHRLRDVEHVIPLLLTDRFADLLRGVGPAIAPPPAWIQARYGESRSLVRGYFAHGARMAAILRRGAPHVTGR